MKAIVLLNCNAGSFTAGGQKLTNDVQAALASAGIEAEIRSVSGESLATAAKSAAREPVDMVIAGGGDGTLSTVAGALVNSEKPFGILPLGTLNHFAKDLGIPLDLPSAAAALAAGNLAQVDVGQVNGRTFINNLSLGAYPRAVVERDAQQKRHGLTKWVAMSLAVFKVFRRWPLVHVQLQLANEKIDRKTPLVFVGNNRYQFELLKMGTRARLDGGELALYIANTQNRWGMFKLTLRALFGRLKQTRDFETLTLKAFTVQSRRHRLHVAVDGEVVRMTPPLEISVRPGALRVCVPPRPVDHVTEPAGLTLAKVPT